jgi:hypothetical protein
MARPARGTRSFAERRGRHLTFRSGRACFVVCAGAVDGLTAAAASPARAAQSPGSAARAEAADSSQSSVTLEATFSRRSGDVEEGMAVGRAMSSLSHSARSCSVRSCDGNYHFSARMDELIA